jgi:hypothetical protein
MVTDYFGASPYFWQIINASIQQTSIEPDVSVAVYCTISYRLQEMWTVLT